MRWREYWRRADGLEGRSKNDGREFVCWNYVFCEMAVILVSFYTVQGRIAID